MRKDVVRNYKEHIQYRRMRGLVNNELRVPNLASKLMGEHM